jgi:hypothetical protein
MTRSETFRGDKNAKALPTVPLGFRLRKQVHPAAMPIMSAGRFSSLGALGIIFFLFLCRPILSF